MNFANLQNLFKKIFIEFYPIVSRNVRSNFRKISSVAIFAEIFPNFEWKVLDNYLAEFDVIFLNEFY